MRGHLHTDVITILVMTGGVFAAAHFFRIVGAKMGTTNMPIVANIGKGVGGFFTLT